MAQTQTSEVKVKGQVIGHAEHTVYASVEEAVQELGDEKVLAAINSTVRNLAAAKIRSKLIPASAKPKTTEQQILALMKGMKKGTIAREDASTKIRELAALLQG